MIIKSNKDKVLIQTKKPTTGRLKKVIYKGY